MENTAYLTLENGRVFRGKALGKRGESLCEIVFATGMTGYMETLSDKSYFGQGVIQTFPLIGNYGVITDDLEDVKPHVSAYIVRECCGGPSNFRCGGPLDEWLEQNGVVGISGVDTRALTRTIRENGVMNGYIGDAPAEDLEKIRSYRIENAVASVSVKAPKHMPAENDGGPVVALLDYGYKKSIPMCLNALGCDVWVLPYDSLAQDIMALKPDGVMLSNGPGDPTDVPESIAVLAELRKTGVPIFGICLGHQLMALAEGFRTSKMKYGHRGQNQPVQRADDGRVFITSQNHGYAVLPESVDSAKAEILFTNVNDGTCEGLKYKDGRAFSVQFHPEAGAGPHDTRFLFTDFVKLMKGVK